jgi:hypothetical protein
VLADTWAVDAAEGSPLDKRTAQGALARVEELARSFTCNRLMRREQDHLARDDSSELPRALLHVDEEPHLLEQVTA